jgi:mono/diheme cytochrome c family protein
MRKTLPLLLVLAAGAAGCPSLDPMWRQQKYKAYQESEAFPDGLAMRTPPAGTIPFRGLPMEEVGSGRGFDGQLLDRLPNALPVTAQLLATGRKRYDIHCAVCHGVLGDGESQVALNMSLRRPPSLHLYRDVPDGHLYQVISRGFGLMSSYAHELTPEERWAVVAYVRALQLSQNAPLDLVPAEERGRLQETR